MPSPPRYVEKTRLAPFGASIATTTSRLPALAGWNAFAVGKSTELLLPVTRARPRGSTATPPPCSLAEPPRYVE